MLILSKMSHLEEFQNEDIARDFCDGITDLEKAGRYSDDILRKTIYTILQPLKADKKEKVFAYAVEDHLYRHKFYLMPKYSVVKPDKTPEDISVLVSSLD